MATVSLSSMLPLVTGIAVIFIAGYLLIYNVFYISIAQDIRFYGMLKTLGTTARQIRKIVYKKQLSYLLWVFLLDYCWDGRLVGCCCLRL